MKSVALSKLLLLYESSSKQLILVEGIFFCFLIIAFTILLSILHDGYSVLAVKS
jgi:hypothetical protein